MLRISSMLCLTIAALLLPVNCRSTDVNGLFTSTTIQTGQIMEFRIIPFLYWALFENQPLPIHPPLDQSLSTVLPALAGLERTSWLTQWWSKSNTGNPWMRLDSLNTLDLNVITLFKQRNSTYLFMMHFWKQLNPVTQKYHQVICRGTFKLFRRVVIPFPTIPVI